MLAPVQPLCATEPDDPSDASARGTRDAQRLAVAHLGPGHDGPGGMPAVLRGLLASPLAERHDLIAIATHRPGGTTAWTVAFARALVAFVRWSLAAPAGLAHVHMTVRGSMYRKAVVVAVATLLRRPVVLHVHAGAVELTTFHARLGPVRRRAMGWVLRRSARVLAGSGASGHVLEARYGAPAVEVVPNAIAPITAGGEGAHASPTPTVLYLGGFANPVKGGAVLVTALPALRRACPQAVVELAGPGQPPAGLRAREGVRWLGWLDETAKRAALERADVFVLPSTSEGLPVALLEAMAHGKAVVASRVGGIPEIVEDGREGLLVEPGDPQRLASALARLLEDRALARTLGAAARARAAELSPERVADRLDVLYREVIADARPG
ncbi:MAG: glycosyltransferase family 4 protein [Actinomycetota bacterium]|nr:glycosyltransferase family 4 protein [Actinomycetota bacterium]